MVRMAVSRNSLNTRVLAGSVVLAILVAGTLGLMIFIVQSLRTSAADAKHSEEVVAAANRLERLALDLETGTRGFVITGQESFLQPFTAASASYPAEARALEALVRDDPVQRARAGHIESAIANYRRTWAAPVIATARANAAAARHIVATGRGKRLMDGVRAQFDSFIATQRRVTERRTSDWDSWGRTGIVVGAIAIAGSLLLILVFGSYLFRLVTSPVRRIAEGARRLAAGDLAARVSEEGVGEIGTLAHDFNVMAESLDRQQVELARRNTELEAVLDATLDGIAMTDPEGNLLFANRKMTDFWTEVGLPTEGTVWDRLILLARRTTTPDGYFDLFGRMASDPGAEVEAEFVLADSGRIFIGYTTGVQDSGGRLVGRIFLNREVTTLRESERVKDEFVATVSHELRTPLTSIVGYTEVLLDGDGLADEQRRFLEVINRNAHRLQRLVGDLLFFAQVESGRLTLESEPVELRALAKRTLEAARPAGEAAGITLELDAPDAVEITGDPARVEQLLDNLLSNAVKFTLPGGRVCVRVAAAEGEAVVQVSDTGIGVPAEEVSSLFRRFFRASSATTRQIPGTGLGLAIAKAIVEAHGGSIDAESSDGGTTFTIHLPRGPAADAHGLPEAVVGSGES
jgi:signal transduction histidine kinase/CHASE3 domain sensor protein